MAEIIWTEPALADLDAIADYIAPSVQEDGVAHVIDKFFSFFSTKSSNKKNIFLKYSCRYWFKLFRISTHGEPVIFVSWDLIKRKELIII